MPKSIQANQEHVQILKNILSAPLKPSAVAAMALEFIEAKEGEDIRFVLRDLNAVSGVRSDKTAIASFAKKTMQKGFIEGLIAKAKGVIDTPAKVPSWAQYAQPNVVEKVTTAPIGWREIPGNEETELEAVKRQLREAQALLSNPQSRKTVQPKAVSVKVTGMKPSANEKYAHVLNFIVKVGSKKTSYKWDFGGPLVTWNKADGVYVEVSQAEVLTTDVRKELALAMAVSSRLFRSDSWL